MILINVKAVDGLQTAIPTERGRDGEEHTLSAFGELEVGCLLFH